jgi:hypothetical protein
MAHAQHVAKQRLSTALRQRTERQEPLDLQNGDMFLYWRSGPGQTVGSYRGPAVCLGTHRALVLGFQGGNFVTAHVSRCLLHRRGPHYVPDRAPAEVLLPSNRDRSLETPLLAPAANDSDALAVPSSPPAAATALDIADMDAALQLAGEDLSASRTEAPRKNFGPDELLSPPSRAQQPGSVVESPVAVDGRHLTGPNDANIPGGQPPMVQPARPVIRLNSAETPVVR